MLNEHFTIFIALELKINSIDIFRFENNIANAQFIFNNFFCQLKE